MELRHLRYFVAIMESKSLREASRRLNIVQSALSKTLSSLEEEIGVKLLTRTSRRMKPTAEGEVFYKEALRALKQCQVTIETTQRAARGELGRLSIGFSYGATYSFLPDLIRAYKRKYPEVQLELKDLAPIQQTTSLAKGTLDLGFTGPLPKELLNSFHSQPLLSQPLLAAVPASWPISQHRIRVEGLATERFILYHREGFPSLFDSIMDLCNAQGFEPYIDSEPDMMQTVLSLVAAEQGVSIVPAFVCNLRCDGVQLRRIEPDYVRAGLFISWSKTHPSSVLQSFLALVEQNKAEIVTKAQASPILVEGQESHE